MALKMSVQLVLMPSSAKREMASRPVSLMGTLTTMLGAILREGAALAQHALDILGDDLGADRTRRDAADLLEDRPRTSRRPWRTASGWWSRRRARPSGRRCGSPRCRRCPGTASWWRSSSVGAAALRLVRRSYTSPAVGRWLEALGSARSARAAASARLGASAAGASATGSGRSAIRGRAPASVISAQVPAPRRGLSRTPSSAHGRAFRQRKKSQNPTAMAP